LDEDDSVKSVQSLKLSFQKAPQFHLPSSYILHLFSDPKTHLKAST